VPRKKGKTISKSKVSKKELIKRYPELYDPKSYPVSYDIMKDGRYRLKRFGKPTNIYYRKIKYKGKWKLVSEEVILHVEEWKTLQKRSQRLSKRIESTKKARASGRWTEYDPSQLSDNRRKVQRKMSKHQIAVEKAGYDFHALV